nr:MAG TPA: hypothetical protein [Caudoviricetes sp.]
MICFLLLGKSHRPRKQICLAQTTCFLLLYLDQMFSLTNHHFFI